ncbi:MAG: hypothetical protein MMC23_009892 [Stictis urceolatum]|nr:hypothetical protein [Stictis urceolata]
MPLLPSLVGGITVRERKERYGGEPRYRRLDLVRSKKSDEEWDIIRSTNPVRAIRVYEAPGAPALPYGHSHPDYRHLVQAPPHQGWPREHRIHQIPAPPLSGGQRPQLERHRSPRLIDQDHGGPPAIISLGLAQESDGDSDGDSVVLEERKPKSRVKHSGHSIFSDGSDSEEDRYRQWRNSSRARSGSRYRYKSDDERRGHSRRRRS